MSFDYSQMAFALALQILDSSPPILVNSQELPLGLETGSAESPDLSSPLSLILEESQHCLASVLDNTLGTHPSGAWTLTWGNVSVQRQ